MPSSTKITGKAVASQKEMKTKKVVRKLKVSSNSKETGKISGYCLPEKRKVTLDEKIKLIKRKLPNGRTVTILCGNCKGCKTKVCKIIANSA